MGSGVDKRLVSPQSPPEPDFFGSVVPPQPTADDIALPVQRRSRKPFIVVGVVVAALLILFCAGRWLTRVEMPISQAPPNGGSFYIPDSLGPVPRVSETDFAPVRDGLIETMAKSHPGVRADFMYYRPTGGGVMSLTMVKGPVSDLLDPATAREVTNVGLVQCGKAYFDLPASGLPSRVTDFPICWRSSGDFSISVFGMGGSITQDIVVDAVSEAWSEQ